jgi:SAM-dependent methyltransferase
MDLDEYRRMADAGATHWWYRSTRALLGQLLAQELARLDPARSLVLDAGGGTGATGAWMAAHATAVLADVEEMALGVARADAPVLPACADVNLLPFGDDVFDLVLCVTVLCHRMNLDPIATVRELGRVARPGGLVCLMEPGVRRLRRGHDAVTHTARRFSVGDLRAVATGAGLHVERATGAYAFLVPAAAALAVVERGRATSDVGRHESGLGGAFGALAAAERALLRRADLPAGLSAIVLARVPLSGP